MSCSMSSNVTSGASDYDSPSAQVIGSDTMVEWLRKARADSSIRAIVLRIDSPGGSAVASDIIWREIMLTRDRKPVIASMSDVAASGGYYIAMPARSTSLASTSRRSSRAATRIYFRRLGHSRPTSERRFWS